VTADGWGLHSQDLAASRRNNEEKPPFCPTFKRTKAIHPLPIPMRPLFDDEGDPRVEFAKLLDLNVNDQRFALVWGWIVASLFSGIERPALWLTGPQGSGKTTAARLISSVTNPVPYVGSNFGKAERDDLTVAGNSYIPSWDNLTKVSQAQSDLICRLVTGFTFSARALYSDNDLHTTSIRRTALFTSINLPIGLGEDALDRLVHVEFDRIDGDKRQSLESMMQTFDELHPRLLAVALDDAASVLRYWHAASETMKGRLERMTEFTILLAALDLAHESEDGEPVFKFVQAFRDSITEARDERAHDDPFTSTLVRLMGSRQTWTISLKDLTNHLATPSHQDGFIPPSWWPTSPRMVADALRRRDHSIRAMGIVPVMRKTKTGREVTFTRVAALTDEQESPAA